MLILSCSMPKAGSGWYNHLTNDLLVAAGYQDKVATRDRYGLGDILKYDNCHMSRPTFFKIRRLVRVSDSGNTFCVHAHSGKLPSVNYFMKRGKIKATYIYRDPRDVVLSAYEHGVRERAAGLRWRNFAKLRTVDLAILWVLLRQLPRYRSWSGEDPEKVHLARYEDLVRDPQTQLRRLADFLGISVSDDMIETIIGRYDRDRRDVGGRSSLHFHVGRIGRFREQLTEQQIARCNRLFGSALADMGYPL